jgi:hypothetical protein
MIHDWHELVTALRILDGQPKLFPRAGMPIAIATSSGYTAIERLVTVKNDNGEIVQVLIVPAA